MFLLRGNQMIKQFIFCGSLGWCFEVFWTGLGSLFKHDKKLIGQSSLHMFPIYGSVIFFEPIMNIIAGLPIIVRGVTYMLCIFAAEYYSGTLLRKINACPWDYSNSRYNVQSVIRLDYALLWFAVGLGFEAAYRYFEWEIKALF